VNKKYLVYSGLMMLLMASQPSFSMGKKLVLNGAKLIGGGTGIYWGLSAANEKYNTYNNIERKLAEVVRVGDLFPEEIQKELRRKGAIAAIAAPVEVEKFARKRMKELNVAGAQSMPVVCVVSGTWAVRGGKALRAGMKEVMELNAALTYKPLLLEQYKQLLQKRSQLNDYITKKNRGSTLATFFLGEPKYSKEDLIIVDTHLDELKKSIDQLDRIIKRDTIILGHEAGHCINEDYKKKIYASAVIPVGVQAVSSTISSTFNKVLGIKNPKTWLRTLFRSSGAVVSIVPKLYISSLAMIPYSRYIETNADDFACKTAKSVEELEAFRDFFKKEEDDLLKKIEETVSVQSEEEGEKLLRWIQWKTDPDHPHLGDRVKHIQEYIDQRNKNPKVE